ncbi:MAG: GDP-mannose 4,6-dehydratase [Isosphaeraceae bacterium]
MTGFWTDRPTLVTGATGLLGGWLVSRLLELGADVVCLIRDQVPASLFQTRGLAGQVKSVRGDVRDQAVLERILGEYEIDTVFHLAAQAIVGIANRNPISTFQTNIEGTWSLLEAGRRSPLVKQIILASSDKAYGHAERLPYDEETPLRGRHPYDVSKSCADLIGQSYASTYGLPVAITRCGNFYGGGDLNWNRIIPGTIRSALKGERPLIRSDGKSGRDYLYVEDGVGAYLTLAETLATRRELIGSAYNFGHNAVVRVLELVQEILKACGRPDLEPDVRGDAANEIPDQWLDPTRASRDLGWHAQFSLSEGIARTVAWYRDHLEGPR